MQRNEVATASVNSRDVVGELVALERRGGAGGDVVDAKARLDEPRRRAPGDCRVGCRRRPRGRVAPGRSRVRARRRSSPRRRRCRAGPGARCDRRGRRDEPRGAAYRSRSTTDSGELPCVALARRARSRPRHDAGHQPEIARIGGRRRRCRRAGRAVGPIAPTQRFKSHRVGSRGSRTTTTSPDAHRRQRRTAVSRSPGRNVGSHRRTLDGDATDEELAASRVTRVNARRALWLTCVRDNWSARRTPRQSKGEAMTLLSRINAAAGRHDHAARGVTRTATCPVACTTRRRPASKPSR